MIAELDGIVMVVGDTYVTKETAWIVRETFLLGRRTYPHQVWCARHTLYSSVVE